MSIDLEDEGHKGVSDRKRFEPTEIIIGAYRRVALASAFAAEIREWPEEDAIRAEKAFLIFASRKYIKDFPAHTNSVVSLRNERKTSILGVEFTYYVNKLGDYIVLHAFIDDPDDDDDSGGDDGGGSALALAVPAASLIVDACTGMACQSDRLVGNGRLRAWSTFVETEIGVWFSLLSNLLLGRIDDVGPLATGLGDICNRAMGGQRERDLHRGDREFVILARELACDDYGDLGAVRDPIPLSSIETWIDADLECRRDVLASYWAIDVRRQAAHGAYCALSADSWAVSADAPLAQSVEMFFDLHFVRLPSGSWLFGFELGRRQDGGDLLAYVQYATLPDGSMKHSGRRAAKLTSRAPAGRLRAVLRKASAL